MSNDDSIHLRLMKEAMDGVDPNSLPRLKVKANWIEIQILTDPFVMKTFLGYTAAVLVETPIEDGKHNLLVSAKSLSDLLEPIRQRRGTLIGLNVRVRKAGQERISPYELEELSD